MKTTAFTILLLLIVLVNIQNVPAQVSRTPKQVFNGLRSAYKHSNRREAAKYATAKAVKELFANGGGISVEPWNFSACEKDKRGYHCFLEYTAGGLNIWIRKVNGKYYVTRVLAIAD